MFMLYPNSVLKEADHFLVGYVIKGFAEIVNGGE